MEPVPSTPAESGPSLPSRATTTGEFPHWLSQAGGTLMVSTYRGNLLALISWDGRQVSLLFRPAERPMGVAVQGRLLGLVTHDRVLVYANARSLAPYFSEHSPQHYDSLYLPRVTYHTGDLQLHDLAWGTEGLWAVNTLFSCLAVPSLDFCFTPRWQPPFITKLVPEDRCHLNGLAMVDGQPRFVTAFGAADGKQGWRPQRFSGGIVIDVTTGETVVRNLNMPHSPRWYGGWLWVLNSGTGELLRIEPRNFQTEVVCALPGYVRGLCFVGAYALVGLGIIREQYKSLSLPVQVRHPQLYCGVGVVDLRTGTLVGMLHFCNGCEELYDVQFLPGVLRPMIVPPSHEAARQALPGLAFSHWRRLPEALA